MSYSLATSTVKLLCRIQVLYQTDPNNGMFTEAHPPFDQRGPWCSANPQNHGSKFCQVQVMIDLIHMLRGIGMTILRTWQAYASLASCRLLSTFGTLPSFPTSLAHGEGDGLRSIETRIFQLLQVRRVDAWILSSTWGAPGEHQFFKNPKTDKERNPKQSMRRIPNSALPSRYKISLWCPNRGLDTPLMYFFHLLPQSMESKTISFTLEKYRRKRKKTQQAYLLKIHPWDLVKSIPV